MPRKKKETRELVRVIRDVRDGRKDYLIPIEEAQSLYDAGKLGWDLTNRSYIELTKDHF